MQCFQIWCVPHLHSGVFTEVQNCLVLNLSLVLGGWKSQKLACHGFGYWLGHHQYKNSLRRGTNNSKAIAIAIKGHRGPDRSFWPNRDDSWCWARWPTTLSTYHPVQVGQRRHKLRYGTESTIFNEFSCHWWFSFQEEQVLACIMNT